MEFLISCHWILPPEPPTAARREYWSRPGGLSLVTQTIQVFCDHFCYMTRGSTTYGEWGSSLMFAHGVLGLHTDNCQSRWVPHGKAHKFKRTLYIGCHIGSSELSTLLSLFRLHLFFIKFVHVFWVVQGFWIM